MKYQEDLQQIINLLNAYSKEYEVNPDAALKEIYRLIPGRTNQENILQVESKNKKKKTDTNKPDKMQAWIDFLQKKQ